jgi:hypothetical protein
MHDFLLALALLGC